MRYHSFRFTFIHIYLPFLINNFSFKCLLDSLEELGEEGLIPLEMMHTIVRAYDKAIFEEVMRSRDEYTVTGVLKAYR